MENGGEISPSLIKRGRADVEEDEEVAGKKVKIGGMSAFDIARLS